MTSFFRKFTWWVQRRRKEDELREELEFHLANEADQRQADGLSADQASWAARRDLGNVTPIGKTRARCGRGSCSITGAGPPLRAADDVPEPLVHRPGRALAGARDRCQHRDLQLHGPILCAPCRCRIRHSLVVVKWQSVAHFRSRRQFVLHR